MADTDTSPAQALAAIRDYFQQLDADRVAFRDWAAGAADGGPNGDGYYPFTMFTGQEILLPSLAKVIAMTENTVEPGDDVWQALQSKIDEIEAAGGGDLNLRPVGTYRIDNALVIDPARVGIEGNAATINANNVPWVNPDSQPELTINGDMSDATPSPSDARAYRGWLIGTSAGTTAAFAGGQAAFTNGGVQMDLGETWDNVANGSRYLEVGQQITAGVGQLVRATITVDWVRSVTIDNGSTQTTQATLNLYFGAPRGADGSPRTLTGMGAASHPSITARKSDFYDKNGTYLGPRSYTIDYLVSSAQFVDPFVRIQTNASARVSALTVKVLPANAALVFTAASDQFGHNLHQITGLRLAGHSAPVAGQRIDAITMNSAVPLSSRIFVTGMQILGSGFRYGVEMGHGTYLCSFTDCLITGAEAGIHTKPDSVDSGENINIRGGVVFSPFGIAIWNEGNFQINAFGISSDFPRQWFKGTGQNRFVACHFEKNGFQGQEGDNLPMIHVNGGQFDVLSGRIQVNQAYFTALRAPFLVEEPGVATFENVNMSNMECTEDVLSVGGGRVRCRGTIGGANIPTLVHRNYDDNLVPDGRCFGTEIGPLTWISSNAAIGTGNARVRVGRGRLEWGTNPVAFDGTLTVGSDLITAQNSASGVLAAGFVLDGDGIPADTVIEAWNSTDVFNNINGLNARTIKMTARATQAGVKALTWRNPAVINTAEAAIDAAVKRTDYEGIEGGGSIKVTKGTGLGNINALRLNRLVRLEPGCGIGVEWFIRRESEPGASAGSNTSIFMRPYWTASHGLDGDGVPILLRDEWAGAINPANDQFVGAEEVITFDRQTGRRRWAFSANTTSGSAIIGGLAANVFAPFKRLQVGDAVTGPGIPNGTTVAEKIQRRHQTTNAIIEELRLSANATATGAGVDLVAVAADPWARWAWGNLNAPNPVTRPDWATHLRIQADLGGQFGPISVWFTDCMATSW